MKSKYPNYKTHRKSNEELEAHLTTSDGQILTKFAEFCAMTTTQTGVEKSRRYLLHFRDIIEKPLDKVTKEDAIRFWGLVHNAPYQDNTKIDIRKIVRRFLKWHYRDLDMIEPLTIPSGPVICFVSDDLGTSVASLLGHPSVEHDCEMVERLFPTSNRFGPLRRRLANRHVHELQGGRFVGVNLPVPRELANYAVHRFDRIGRIDRFANRRWKVE